MGFQWVTNKVSTVTSSDTASAADAWVTMKNALTVDLPVAQRWAVAGSSNSTVAAMDGVDRLVAYTDVVANTGVHSWAVLRDKRGLSVVWDWSVANADQRRARVLMSPSAGFTGGSTTARPTATDEVDVHLDGNGWWLSYGAQRFVINVAQRDDNKETYVWSYRQGVHGWLWATFVADQVVPGWTAPQVGMIGLIGNGLNNPATGFPVRAKARGPSGVMTLDFTMHGVHNQVLGRDSHQSDLAPGRFVPYPMGLHSPTTGMKGRHGRCRNLIVATANTSSRPNSPYLGESMKTLAGVEWVSVSPGVGVIPGFYAPWKTGIIAVTS